MARPLRALQPEPLSHPLDPIRRRVLVEAVLRVVPTKLLRLPSSGRELLGPLDRHVDVVSSELEEDRRRGKLRDPSDRIEGRHLLDERLPFFPLEAGVVEEPIGGPRRSRHQCVA